MQENVKEVIVKMTARRAFRTEPIWQYDAGHVLVFEGFEGLLPATFQVDYSLSPTGKSIPQIGQNGVCVLPEMFTQTAAPIYAWLYIADTETGLTKYSIEIPVQRRAKPTDQEPTPVEQSAIDQAIAALNDGVEAAEDAQEAAEAAQEAAETAQGQAEDAATRAANSATDANASREFADQSATAAQVAQGKAETAQTKAETAQGKAEDAQAAAEAAVGSYDAMTATATTLQPGSSATAEIDRTGDHPVLQLGLPQGETGATPDFSIGTVSTLQPGQDATATITGTAAAPVLNLGIPQGDHGTVPIDDTAGVGDVTKVWSADKSATERNSVLSAINELPDIYAQQDGEYPDLTSGNTLEVLSDRGTSDTEPYLFRKAVGWNRAKLNAVTGGTLPWNQFADNENTSGDHFAETWATTISISNGEITVTNARDYSQLGLNFVEKKRLIQNNHVYFLTLDIKSAGFSPTAISADLTDNWRNICNAGQKTYTGTGRYSWIGKANGSGTEDMPQRILIRVNGDVKTNDSVVFKNCMWVDLTLLFGSTVADYIYSLETDTAGAGVAIARKWGNITKDYYEYNPGQLISVSGLQSRETVGFNQWDEEWRLGLYDVSGNWVARDDYFSSKNMIPVVPSATYYFNHGKSTSSSYYICYYDADGNFIVRNAYNLKPSKESFTVPSNAHFINFTLPAYDTTYNHDLCINISDTSRNGTYKPYIKHGYPLDSSLTLRGVPKLVDNKLAFDGDRYLPDGTVERRYGVVDLGGLTWSKQDGDPGQLQRFFSTGIANTVSKAGTVMLNLVCGKYVPSANPVYNRTDDKTMCVLSSTGGLYIIDADYTDVTAFKASLSGVYLIYELATPTTETADPYRNLQIQEKGGTEAFISNAELPVPVGHETFYPVNVFDYIDEAIATAVAAL